ncbi:hypothetical protein PUN28_017923 [Cardiocondyla obscurior]|uniref:Uncharacterized protein n=1 Tax=Cardiocondyla obscurior TaxID=286306 RepID=A0AAW2ENB4_9HYME
MSATRPNDLKKRTKVLVVSARLNSLKKPWRTIGRMSARRPNALEKENRNSRTQRSAKHFKNLSRAKDTFVRTALACIVLCTSRLSDDTSYSTEPSGRALNSLKKRSSANDTFVRTAVLRRARSRAPCCFTARRYVRTARTAESSRYKISSSRIHQFLRYPASKRSPRAWRTFGRMSARRPKDLKKRTKVLVVSAKLNSLKKRSSANDTFVRTAVLRRARLYIRRNATVRPDRELACIVLCTSRRSDDTSYSTEPSGRAVGDARSNARRYMGAGGEISTPRGLSRCGAR